MFSFSKLLPLWVILWKGLGRAKRQWIVERRIIYFPFLKNKRVKTGRQGKIYSCHWSPLANFIKAFPAYSLCETKQALIYLNLPDIMRVLLISGNRKKSYWVFYAVVRVKQFPLLQIDTDGNVIQLTRSLKSSLDVSSFQTAWRSKNYFSIYTRPFPFDRSFH